MDISYYKKYEPIFGSWHIVREIGEGSFGKVFEIEREDFGYTYKAALKAISIPQNEAELDSILDSGMDMDSASTYCRGIVKELNEEFHLMSKLKGSSNVVSYEDHSVIEHSDGPGWDILIRMELLTPLVRYTRNHPLGRDDVIKLGIDICKALELCRKNGIVHRDIKPENIFFSDEGQFKLGDFGIAKTMEHTTGSIGKKGTYSYMAPEVYKGEAYGQRVDQYSLGIMLYRYMNMGRLPFQPPAPAPLKLSDNERAVTRRVNGERLPPPCNADEQFAAIILKACAYDPKDRFASPQEMREALEVLPRVASTASASIFCETREALEVLPRELGNDTGAYTEKTVSSYKTIPAGVIRRDRDNTEETVGIFRSEKSAPKPEQKKEELPQYRKTEIIEDQAEMTVKESIAADPTAVEKGIIVNTADSGRKEERKKPAKPKKKKAGILFAAAAAVLAVVIGVIAFSDKTPKQVEWTEWMSALPADISEDEYEIEQKTEYRSRDSETKTSSKSTMEGWELIDTTVSGKYGSWSDWSTEKVSKSDTRKVETEKRYRSRTLETTTSSKSSLSGWTQTDKKSSWGSYGSWSDWSTSAVSSSDSRKVETKTQYSYRTVSYSTQYTGWGSWSSWQNSSVSSNSTTDVETRTVYHYYYYLCPNCGIHMHQYTNCLRWAGGCGGNIPSNAYHTVVSTTPYTSTSDFGGTGVYYIGSGSSRCYAYINSGSQYYVSPWTQYRYRTRSTQQVASYSDWSSYSDTYQSSSSTKEVRTRTLYRYCDKSKNTTYTYEKWGAWSSWTTTPISSSSTKQVETKTFYTYKDKTDKTKYTFIKWSDWSVWSETPIEKTDTNEVETAVSYRYKSR